MAGVAVSIRRYGWQRSGKGIRNLEKSNVLLMKKMLPVRFFFYRARVFFVMLVLFLLAYWVWSAFE
jgi:hypothetical protein